MLQSILFNINILKQVNKIQARLSTTFRKKNTNCKRNFSFWRHQIYFLWKEENRATLKFNQSRLIDIREWFRVVVDDEKRTNHRWIVLQNEKRRLFRKLGGDTWRWTTSHQIQLKWSFVTDWISQSKFRVEEFEVNSICNVFRQQLKSKLS